MWLGELFLNVSMIPSDLPHTFCANMLKLHHQDSYLSATVWYISLLVLFQVEVICIFCHFAAVLIYMYEDTVIVEKYDLLLCFSWAYSTNSNSSQPQDPFE